MRVMVTHVAGWEQALQGFASRLGMRLNSRADERMLVDRIFQMGYVPHVREVMTVWFSIDASRVFWDDVGKFAVTARLQSTGVLVATYGQLWNMKHTVVQATGPEFREFLVSLCVLPHHHLLAGNGACPAPGYEDEHVWDETRQGRHDMLRVPG